MNVVPLKAYCAITHETADAVKARIERGIWREGVHYHKIKNVRERWIDLTEVEKWARNQGSSRAA